MNSSLLPGLAARGARRPRGDSPVRLRLAALLTIAALCSPACIRAQSFVAEWSTDDIGRLAPTGLALDQSGSSTYLYVCDQVGGRIMKFDTATGRRVAVFGEVGNGDLQFNSPFGIAIDPVSHDLYIAERGNSRVQRITSSGAFVMKWGLPGSAPGEFNQPIGIAADEAGNVYVVDHGNNRIQKFHVANGQAQHVASWGSTGAAGGQFNAPYGLTRDASGNLWVADGGNHRLQKFDPDGHFLGSVGTLGTGDGEFVTPVWVNFDAAGNYYVAETNSDPQNLAAADLQNQRIQKFDADGTFLSKWGSYGESGGQFRLPFDIVVDDAGEAFVADYYNTRLQKFTLDDTAPPPAGAEFVNLSSRLRTVDNDTSRAFIAGFVVHGSAPKTMLVRAIGPGLQQFGVSGFLANPKLAIVAADGTTLAENEDWAGADVAAVAQRVGAFPLVPGSHDAALLVTLPPGVYSAHVIANGGDGVALAEVYDAGETATGATLVNLSTRGFVETGDRVLVAGFVVDGTAPKRVLVRGIGPSLAQFGVTRVLADSVLKIFTANNVLVAQNDNWETPQAVAGGSAPASGADLAAAAQTTGAFSLKTGTRDAAVLITLQPGAYSAVVSGAGGTTGAGLVEVYELP